MNLTLEQAMAQATKGPLHIENGTLVWAERGCFAKLGQGPGPLINGREEALANLALLAHWYNRGPELVEALQSALDAEAKAYEWHGHLCLMDGVREKIKELLARANTITIPD